MKTSIQEILKTFKGCLRYNFLINDQITSVYAYSIEEAELFVYPVINPIIFTITK